MPVPCRHIVEQRHHAPAHRPAHPIISELPAGQRVQAWKYEISACVVVADVATRTRAA